MNWSPLATLPVNVWISGFAFSFAATAFFTSSLSAGNDNVSILGICPAGSPNTVASISWCSASVEMTMSPISICASSEPAIPVLINVSAPNWLTRICAQIPALTLPIPLLTITTSFPPSVPLQNTIPAISTVSSICISFFSSATSSSIAPIIPIIYLYPPVFHEFTYALL